MKEIYIYTNFHSWVEEAPDATIKGTIVRKNDYTLEILDNQGYTQIIVLDKLYAVVY